MLHGAGKDKFWSLRDSVGAAAWGGSGVAAEGWVRRKLRVVPLAVRWGAQAAAARAALRDELMGECVAPLDALLQAGTGFRALLYAGTRDVAANPLAFEATLRALRSGEGERLGETVRIRVVVHKRLQLLSHVVTITRGAASLLC